MSPRFGGIPITKQLRHSSICLATSSRPASKHSTLSSQSLPSSAQRSPHALNRISIFAVATPRTPSGVSSKSAGGSGEARASTGGFAGALGCSYLTLLASASAAFSMESSILTLLPSASCHAFNAGLS